MTGRDRNQTRKGKRRVAAQQVDQHQQNRQSRQQPDQQTVISTSSQQSNQSGQSTQSQAIQQVVQTDETSSNAPSVQLKPSTAAKKMIKAEIDESRTLKHVFKSNPDSQMKDFIKKAAKPSQPAIAKNLPKTPAEAHPPAVVQELLETDDDVADNLGKLFKASKSYKNL